MRIPLRGDRSHEARPERFGRSLAPSPREIYPPTICVASGDWIGFVSSEKVLVLQPTMTAKRRETTGWERNSPGGRQHFPTTQSKRAVQNAPRSNPLEGSNGQAGGRTAGKGDPYSTVPLSVWQDADGEIT